MKRFLSVIFRALSSRYFFLIILLIFAAQGAWYALSFAPVIYDEAVHIGTVYFYTENINPFNAVQGEEWDFLGEATRSSSYLLFYILSFPLRLIMLITSSETVQVVVLRFLMIPIFLTALVYLKKAIVRAGVGAAIVNVAFLIFALIPIFSVMPGVVSYDVALFLIFALLLYFCSRVITDKRLNLIDVAMIYSLSAIALVVKGSSALALSVPVLIYMSIYLARLYRKNIYRNISKSFVLMSNFHRVLLIGLILVPTLLVIERPVINAVNYQGFNAPCSEIKSVDRCNSNFTARSNNKLAEQKSHEFKPFSPYEYMLTLWVPGLVNTMMRPLPTPAPFPIMQFALFSALVTGTALILIYLRELLRNRVLQLLLLVLVAYLAALFMSNYSAYLNIGQPVAMSGRYLLYVVPVFGILVGESIRRLIKDGLPRGIATFLLVGFVLCVMQGGGVATYLLTYDKYWSDDTELINKNMKSIVSPVIIERTPFRTF